MHQSQRPQQHLPQLLHMGRVRRDGLDLRGARLQHGVVRRWGLVAPVRERR
jgi:hypothetical protein